MGVYGGVWVGVGDNVGVGVMDGVREGVGEGVGVGVAPFWIMTVWSLKPSPLTVTVACLSGPVFFSKLILTRPLVFLASSQLAPDLTRHFTLDFTVSNSVPASDVTDKYGGDIISRFFLAFVLLEISFALKKIPARVSP